MNRVDDGMKDEEEDTSLDRSRAERRGGGGGPTREEEHEEQPEDEFKSDLLARVLGLEDSPYRFFGWLEGGFMGNPARPSNGMNFGVNPNSVANAWKFQQLYLVAERLVEPNDRVNFGFRSDLLFGTDWQQFHMVGLFDRVFPLNGFGFDPVQFYGEVHLPVLTRGGVDIKGGRFYALAGYEDGMAPARPLDSASYMFGYSHPFTHFGVMSTWHVTDRLNLYNGAVNGWDRWINQNDRWGYAGGVSWDSADDRTSLSITINAGPIQSSRFFPVGYPLTPNGVTTPPYLARLRNVLYGGDSALLFTTVLIHKFSEALTVIGETDQGFEANVPGFGSGGTPQNAEWYGLGGWVLYTFTEKVTGVYRAEVFRDNNGVRTGFADTFYEMTLGAIYKPKTWFWLRPEVRFDWATGEPPYDAGHSRSQFTLGFDAIFLF